MNTVVRVILLACSIALAGCRKDGQVSKEQVPEKEAPSIIAIENLATTEKNLTLDYKVSNPFLYDIWVCQDIDSEGKCHVETRIEPETVWIKLKFKVERNVFRDPLAIGEYLCLPPGDSRAARVVLELPIRNASPVYEFHERGKSRTQIVLQRAVFEIGYFDGAFIDKVAKGIEKRKRDPVLQKTLIRPRIVVVVVVEEEGSRSRRLLRPRETWPGIVREKSAEVVITDVNIACSIVVDDKQQEQEARNEHP